MTNFLLNQEIIDNFEVILNNPGDFTTKQAINDFLSVKKPRYETALKFLEIYNNYYQVDYSFEEVFDFRHINWYENINWNSQFDNQFTNESVFRRVSRRGIFENPYIYAVLLLIWLLLAGILTYLIAGLILK